MLSSRARNRFLGRRACGRSRCGGETGEAPTRAAGAPSGGTAPRVHFTSGTFRHAGALARLSDELESGRTVRSRDVIEGRVKINFGLLSLEGAGSGPDASPPHK